MKDPIGDRSRSFCGGARTRACRAGIRAGSCVAESRLPRSVCAGPAIILGPRDQSGLHGVVLDVSGDASPFGLVAHPVVVRFALPKRLPRSAQQTVRFASRVPLQRFEQPAGRHQRQQQNVHVVGHQNERAQMIMAEFHAASKRVDDQTGNGFLPQKQRAGRGRIQAPVHPHEGLTGGDLPRWRVHCSRKAAVQVPGHEQPAALGVQVWQAAGTHNVEGCEYRGNNLSCTRVCTRHARVRAPRSLNSASCQESGAEAGAEE